MQVIPLQSDPVPKVVLHFRRRIDEPNIQGSFWLSYDLANWQLLEPGSPDYEEMVIPETTPEYEHVEATIYPDPALQDSMFLRFRVIMQ